MKMTLIEPAIAHDKPIVTLSWDDGHPLDLRMARLMADLGLSATFYVPVSIKGPTLDHSQLIELSQMGMEIGSHGLTHSALTSAPDVQRELAESKDKLEQMIGKPVSSFCYPFGKFNRKVAAVAHSAGYSLARTTVGFRIAREFDRFRMPVTLQFAQHSRLTHLRHALHEGNLRGIVTWGFRGHFEPELMQLAQFAFDEAYRANGIFHMWGHSWEVNDLGLWDMLTEFCRYIARRPGVTYVANSFVVSPEKE
jgi:peptidoglycan/xylan/chitin deacetylase (PgdA/CDA1 family)